MDKLALNVVALIFNCNPLDVSLIPRFCEFSIFKHGSMILKGIPSVATNNAFSVYGKNYVQISAKYNCELDECIHIISSIRQGLTLSLKNYRQCYITVLKDIIEARDGKASESLSIDNFHFLYL